MRKSGLSKKSQSRRMAMPVGEIRSGDSMYNSFILRRMKSPVQGHKLIITEAIGDNIYYLIESNSQCQLHYCSADKGPLQTSTMAYKHVPWKSRKGSTILSARVCAGDLFSFRMAHLFCHWHKSKNAQFVSSQRLFKSPSLQDILMNTKRPSLLLPWPSRFTVRP